MTASGVAKGVSRLLGSSTQTAGVKDIHQVLFDEDVEIRVKIIESLAQELKGYPEKLSPSVELALTSVEEALTLIAIELACIDNKITNAQKPYWYFWKRGGNFMPNVINIERLMGRFNKRVEILLQLLRIKTE